MFRLLLKKQMTEIFRMYFYDAKKNKARSAGSVVAMFILFAFLLAYGGVMFFMLGMALCGPLCTAGMGWLYFFIIGGMALFLGMIGSAFSTYNMLYVSKDNDLLLSMPIPVKHIVASRVTCVYLLGLLYASVIIIPCYIVYFIVNPSVQAIFGAVIFTAVISVITLSLACLLGWVVAKISRKIKHKSIVTVIAALAFIALYYVVYFKAMGVIRDLVANAAEYGEKIRGSAYVLYLFGRLGEGDLLAALVFSAFAAVLLLLVTLLLRKTFFGFAASASASVSAGAVYREKKEKASGVVAALFKKEFARFTSSSNYMLNCGLGCVMMPLAGAALLWRGRDLISSILPTLPEKYAGFIPVAVCMIVCFLCTMNEIAVPSVSLEGKNLWIVKSMPVTAFDFLSAKLYLHLAMTCAPLLFCAVCASVAVGTGVAVCVLIPVVCLLFALFSALAGLLIGLRLPDLNWTNEIVPIKQGRAVFFSIFGGWLLTVLLGLPYLLAVRVMSAAAYLGIIAALLAAGCAALYAVMKKHGQRLYDEL